MVQKLHELLRRQVRRLLAASVDTTAARFTKYPQPYLLASKHTQHGTRIQKKQEAGCPRSTETYQCWPPLQLDSSRHSYDYLTTMPKIRSTYDGRPIYETSYEERKAFLRHDSL